MKMVIENLDVLLCMSDDDILSLIDWLDQANKLQKCRIEIAQGLKDTVDRICERYRRPPYDSPAMRQALKEIRAAVEDCCAGLYGPKEA